jgi:hypothetical protein
MRRIEDLKISFVLFISSLFKRKPKIKRLKDVDFSTSTQKMGLTFTDKIRDFFRHKWINKK